MRVQMTKARGAAIVVLGGLMAALPASAEDELTWQFTKEEGALPAELAYGGRETDNVTMKSVCAYDGQERRMNVTVAADIGDLKKGRTVGVLFSGGGFDQTVRGTVTRPKTDEGMSGVELVLAEDDPLWQAMLDGEAMDFLVQGRLATRLSFGKGKDKIKKFLDSCAKAVAITKASEPKTTVAKEEDDDTAPEKASEPEPKPEEKPTKKAEAEVKEKDEPEEKVAAKDDADNDAADKPAKSEDAAEPNEAGADKDASPNSAAEREAFSAAKKDDTRDAWNDFLKDYPTGFRADLARAYVKKLDATPAAKPASKDTIARVTYPGGAFVKTGAETWVDRPEKGAESKYQEVSRTAADVILFDKPTDKVITLDFSKNVVWSAKGSGERVKLHEIITKTADGEDK